MIKKTDKTKATTTDQSAAKLESALFPPDDRETARLRFLLKKAVGSESAPEELRTRISRMIRQA